MPIELGPPSWQYPLDAHWEHAFEQRLAEASGAIASITKVVSAVALFMVARVVLRAGAEVPRFFELKAVVALVWNALVVIVR